ncbi:MAG: amidohydrolase family protein, partial [Bacteroidetes bacterium]|nr:amidohydrolase family protein [Bacteroidota bacterium]
YNKDPNDQIYIIKRYDRNTGKSEKVTGGPGSAFRPQVSHNDKWLAFVKRIRTKTVLFLHNLETGEEYPIFDGLSKDQSEAWAIFGVYTGFDWGNDDKNIIIWGKGKLWNIDITTKKATEIPFIVNATHRLAETVKFKQKVDSDEFDVRVIRQLVTSPNGNTLIFNAIGHLWKMESRSDPIRLTSDKHLEFEPSFSRDGSKLLFVSWDDEQMGAIWEMNLKNGKKVKLTKDKGIYRTPAYSPDGKLIIFTKEKGNGHQGYTYTKEPGIYMMSVNGRQPKKISKEGSYPTFSADGKKIFYHTGGGPFGTLKKAYKYIDLETLKVDTLFTSKFAHHIILSPDNKWFAFTDLYKVYIAALPMHGKKIDLSSDTKAIPLAQVAKDAGINVHWSADSKKLHWTLGNKYFTALLTDRFLFLAGAVDSLPPLDSVGSKITLKIKSDKPIGYTAFTGARIITMEGDEVIENGTILIKDNMIQEMGTEVSIPESAKIFAIDGKTIMPGIIDVHAHLGAFRFGLSPQKHWQYYTNLAYGVTTTHDPSSNTEMALSQAEMVKAGKMIGPRIYTTGTILYGAEGDFKAVINNLEDAKSAIRRTQAFGAFSVKSYNQPRREQRQQVIEAGRQLGVMIYTEGGSHYNHNMSMVVDGHTSIEHNIPVVPLYDDVIQLWKNAGTSNAPTLIVNYGGINGEYYWYDKTNVWEKERLLNFTPRHMVDSRSRHRTTIPDEEYENGHILTAASCKKLNDQGVNIGLGAHGQLQGLGAHWELWMFEQGGMSPMQALKCATINGARYIGMEDEIGSLKVGKLADLIVIDGNPLEDLRKTENVVYTMINGRLYDSSTMNEIGNYDKKRGKFYWEMEGSGNAYPFFEETGSFMRPHCRCQQ